MMRTLLFSSVLYEMNPVMLCVSKTNIRLGGPDYFVHTYLRKQSEMMNQMPHMIPSPDRLQTCSACSFDSI